MRSGTAGGDMSGERTTSAVPVEPPGDAGPEEERSDLDLGFDDWSGLFVSLAPSRSRTSLLEPVVEQAC
jgi:hypothetical protein